MTAQSIVIVGGGIIGSCIAFYLRECGFRGRVRVLERDSSYQFSSTALSAASIRTQFGCDVNVRMSLYGVEVLRDAGRLFGADADVGFVERGYLIVGGTAVASARAAAAQTQNQLGAAIDVCDHEGLRRRFPWLNADDLAIGTYGRRNEGWFDAWTLLRVVQGAGRARGVEFVKSDVLGIEAHSERVEALRTTTEKRLPADVIVVAGGAWSAGLLAPLGISLPVEPRKRTVFRIKAPLDPSGFPMLFDNSGAWIRPEGEDFICGIAPPPDRDPHAEGDFEPDWWLLDEVLWPALAHRVPALEAMRVLSAWAGHYEYNWLDHNGIIGACPPFTNLYVATGFSGHGVMHAPAAGRGVAELIVDGGYRTLDLSSLGFDRIRTGRPLQESVVY
jgi:glycine/D-amino acid oxidase-like deaminating enzyme